MQMIRERLAPRRQDANDYEAASNLSRKVGLPEFPYKRLLKVLVALSTLISFPISAHATLYVVVLDAREIAIASDGKWLIVPGDNSAPVSQIKEKVIRLSPQTGIHVRWTHGNRHNVGQNPSGPKRLKYSEGREPRWKGPMPADDCDGRAFAYSLRYCEKHAILPHFYLSFSGFTGIGRISYSISNCPEPVRFYYPFSDN